jgi:hypothetical protein
MAKQLKKFCRITKYIEKTDPKLYEILDDLCVLGSLRPRRGHNGITFIWPSKETISKLDKLRYSDDIEKGVDLVLNHIVHDYIPSASAWTQKKSDIPTGLNRKLEVKEVKGSKVILVDGAELELDPKFKTFSRDEDRQAVWEVKKGNIDPSKHTKQASFEHARQGIKSQHRQPPVTGAGVKDDVQDFLKSLATAFKNRSADESNKLWGVLASALAYAQTLDDNVKKVVAIVASPLPVSTLAFLKAQPECKYALSKFWNDFEASDEFNSRHLYGMNAYLARLYSMRNDMGVKGGMTRNELDVELAKAIEKTLKQSEELLKDHNIPEDDLCPRMFTELNLARMCEYNMLSNLLKNHTNTPNDIKSDLEEMADIINDRATCKSTDTDRSSNSLGILIVGLLNEIRNFHSSDFSKYPLKSQDLNSKMEELTRKVSNDTSPHNLFSKLPADQLAAFFGQLDDSQSKSKEGEAANVPETSEE